jgi:hypothetical protein
VEGVGDPEANGRVELQAQRQCGTRPAQRPPWRREPGGVGGGELRTSRSPPWPVPLGNELSVVEVDGRMRACLRCRCQCSGWGCCR